MISDVLAEASAQIYAYLSDAAFEHVYQGSLRQKILRLAMAMDEVTRELNTPPKR